MTENFSLIKVLKNRNSYIQVCTIYINILTNLRIVKNVYQYINDVIYKKATIYNNI